LEINLNAILHNINFHKSLLKPETKMMAMVKANAYGLGSYEISEFFSIIILIILVLHLQMKV
jgi:alanine racemase